MFKYNFIHENSSLETIKIIHTIKKYEEFLQHATSIIFLHHFRLEFHSRLHILSEKTIRNIVIVKFVSFSMQENYFNNNLFFENCSIS